MDIVKDCPLDLCCSEKLWQSRFPDSFSYPHAAGSYAEIALYAFCQATNLGKFVFVGNGRKYGFVVASAHYLYLSTLDEKRNTLQACRLCFFHPIKE